MLISVSIGIGLAVAWPAPLDWQLRAVIGWDGAALVLLGLVWPQIATADPARTRLRAAAKDPGRKAVFLLAVTSSVISLLASVSVLRRARSFSPAESALWSGLAFTIGMCFQVSDVAITSAPLRSTALVHAVLSFGYNTTILALVLNLVFGFLT